MYVEGILSIGTGNGLKYESREMSGERVSNVRVRSDPT